MKQLINHVSQETAFINSEPAGHQCFAPIKYWVEHSKHLSKDRLFTQLFWNNNWSTPKVKGNADIIILQQHPFESDKRGLVEPILFNVVNEIFESTLAFSAYFILNNVQKMKIINEIGHELGLSGKPIIWKDTDQPIIDPILETRKVSNVTNEKLRQKIWKALTKLKTGDASTHEEYVQQREFNLQKAQEETPGTFEILMRFWPDEKERSRDIWENAFDEQYLVNKYGGRTEFEWNYCQGKASVV